MESIFGEFHKVEKNGKLYLVYQHPDDSLLRTQIPSFAGDFHVPPLFICPSWLGFKDYQSVLSLDPSSECIFPITHSDDSFNDNLTFSSSSIDISYFFLRDDLSFSTDDPNAPCLICRNSVLRTNFYKCKYCAEKFHKECLESSIKLKHPHHPDHTLKLTYLIRSSLIRSSSSDDRVNECLHCGRSTKGLAYHCSMCQVFMHPVCAMKSIPFVIDRTKNHIHPLTFFPRQASLTCNVCGLLRKNHPTYVCFICNFVSHNDCMNYPHTIKISRHNHRISLTLSLLSREWSCGVCRLNVNNEYGGYTCDKCSDYVVHPICATGQKVWDGKELEGLLDEDDITKDARPFEMVSEGVILHFLYKHHLRIEVSIFYDENKVCQACALPIYEGKFYSCKEYEFILHEKCAKAPRRIQHALHSHPLILQDLSSSCFRCDACGYVCGGFFYSCHKKGCNFTLDIRCASVSEPFDFKGHGDPLYLALDQEVNLICQVCKKECQKQLNCIKCNFIICFRCITLPYKAKYKHDLHFLTLSYGKEVPEYDWCEVCEYNLKDTKVFYGCKECNTSFHIECLFGKDPYTIPGQIFSRRFCYRTVINNNLSRPLCDNCKNYCQKKIYKRLYYSFGQKIDTCYKYSGNVACSLKCLF